MMEEFTGVFGLWKFPLLNMLRQMLSQRRLAPAAQSVTPALTQVTQNNEESWDLVRNERGRLVNVVVHRKVTQNEHD